MDLLVSSGKVRYVGIGNYLGWQRQKAVDMCWSPLSGGWLTGIAHRGMIGPPAGSRIDLE